MKPYIKHPDPAVQALAEAYCATVDREYRPPGITDAGVQRVTAAWQQLRRALKPDEWVGVSLTHVRAWAGRPIPAFLSDSPAPPPAPEPMKGHDVESIFGDLF